MSLLFTPESFLFLDVLEFAENVRKVLLGLFDNVNLFFYPILSVF